MEVADLIISTSPESQQDILAIFQASLPKQVFQQFVS
jgi:hypothetical protein